MIDLEPRIWEVDTLHFVSPTALGLNGGVIRLKPSAVHQSLLYQDTAVESCVILNGTLDGNYPGQPALITGEAGYVFSPMMRLVPGCHRWIFSDLDIVRPSQYAIHASNCDGVWADDIRISDARGGGWWWKGDNCHFNFFDVRDVVNIEGTGNRNSQGNPFIINCTNSTVGPLRCENYGFGIKFPNGCENLTVGSIEAIAGPNNDPANGGDAKLVKIQGDGSPYQGPLTFNSIRASGSRAQGLYIIDSQGVEIGEYVGTDNGQDGSLDGSGADLYIARARDPVHFGSVTILGDPAWAIVLGSGNEAAVAADTYSIPAGKGSVNGGSWNGQTGIFS